MRTPTPCPPTNLSTHLHAPQLTQAPQTMRTFLHTLRALALLAGLAVLSGCATHRLIDSDVLTTAAVPAGQSLQGATYRFERLPSQVHNPQAGLAEQHAQAAMTAVGLVRSDAQARLSVQVGFSAHSFLADPWGRPLAHGMGMPGFGHIQMGHSGRRSQVSVGIGTGFGLGVGHHMGMRFAPTHHRHEVSLLMRDLTSGQVVYETRASHDGPWGDSDTVFATLFQAAMAQFPNPPAGPRRVNIEIAR